MIVITGCSSGFGLEAALAFARRGDTVVATMRDLARADALRDRTAAENLAVHLERFDVCDDASVETAIAGGEIAGFLRALIAAGAGAIGLPLWDVIDRRAVRTIRNLLGTSRRCVDEGRTFDVVATLHHQYAEDCEGEADQQQMIEACPIALYL